MNTNENTLSIFVDESGSFDSDIFPSRFYVVSCIFHDQSVDISEHLNRLEMSLAHLGLSGLCLHAGPLIRREERFKDMDIQIRRQIFGRLMAFARRLPIRGWALCADKQYDSPVEALDNKLRTQFHDRVSSNRNYLRSYSKIKIYYDNGQPRVKSMLKEAFAEFPVEFPANVTPGRYRLFQVADLICTMALLKAKLNAEIPITKSETYFFHNVYELRKDFICPLSHLISCPNP